VGWTGSRSTREHVLGSNIDPIVEQAPCETTLIKLADEPDSQRSTDETEDVVVLAGDGPHAPVATRRAVEYVAATEDTALTLLNVQSSDTDDETPPEERGEATIERLVEASSLDGVDYDTRIVVTNGEIRPAILDAVADYDTVSVGATRTGAVSQALFGSIPEAIGERSDGTVVMARDASQTPRSVRDAIVHRLSE